jgi:hypothetical protein
MSLAAVGRAPRYVRPLASAARIARARWLAKAAEKRDRSTGTGKGQPAPLTSPYTAAATWRLYRSETSQKGGEAYFAPATE